MEPDNTLTEREKTRKVSVHNLWDILHNTKITLEPDNVVWGFRSIAVEHPCSEKEENLMYFLCTQKI